MNGFGNELRDRTLSMTSHATVSGYDGYLRDWPAAIAKAKTNQEVIAAAPYINKEVMLSNGRRVSGSLIRGIQPEMESQVSLVESKMISGSLTDIKAGEYGIVLGKELANTLGVYEGDPRSGERNLGRKPEQICGRAPEQQGAQPGKGQDRRRDAGDHEAGLAAGKQLRPGEDGA